MKYFIDTEFMEQPCTISLISIGIAAADGREYYGVNKQADLSSANDWVKKNVLPQLPPFDQWKMRHEIREDILAFIGDDKPEFWGYFADYDWVVFCWLFGRMIDLPKGWPMYCRDLKQWADQLGVKEFPAQLSKEHDALSDAKWNRGIWRFLDRAQERRR